MKAYFIHPILTIGDLQLAQSFFEICNDELDQHIEVVPIRSESRILSSEISKEDFILFFNRTDESYKSSFINFLEEACEIKAELIPIAVSKESRVPPKIANKFQSFDIVEHLRKRCLTETNISTIALSLARTVISLMQPTLSSEKMHIFISHRRFDGEEIAADFCKEIRIRAENSAFRDLIDIRVGEDAQEIIEHNLKKSDVVVFLDTPMSGESYWIAKELKVALGMNIPIIWIKIGDLEGRPNLKVRPADKPHFEVDYLKIKGSEESTTLIDDIIHKAFLIYREYSKNVFDKIHIMKNIAKNNGIAFSKLDTKNMIYKVEIPRKGFRYYQKPMIHIVQCFNRLPKDKEVENLDLILASLGYEKHPSYGPYYDAGILLAPIKERYECFENPCVVDSFDEYICNFEKYFSQNKLSVFNKRGIIISGAFPDCETEHQQHLTDAVYAFVQEILQRQATVIFGAHPTFQNMIFNLGMNQRTEDYQKLIHMYISKFFVIDGAIDEYKKNATVFATNNMENSRDKSLTFMRETMINDENAMALVCIGGKTKAGGHNPGVDEEIAFARRKGLPVFIIGSAGGRSAEIASELDFNGWKYKFNDLSLETNKQLMVSLDYKVLASEILNSLGI